MHSCTVTFLVMAGCKVIHDTCFISTLVRALSQLARRPAPADASHRACPSATQPATLTCERLPDNTPNGGPCPRRSVRRECHSSGALCELRCFPTSSDTLYFAPCNWLVVAFGGTESKGLQTTRLPFREDLCIPAGQQQKEQQHSAECDGRNEKVAAPSQQLCNGPGRTADSELG